MLENHWIIYWILFIAILVWLIRLQLENRKLKAELAKFSPQPVKASGEFTYLALGNSITEHPLCSYWWHHKCGMAASAPEHDFVHLVAKGLESKVGEVNLSVHSFYLWEVQTLDRAETLCLLDAKLTPAVKLITVQLGENAQDFATLERDLVELLRYLKAKAPQAQIIEVGDFWLAERNEIRKRAAQTAGCAFADLQEIIGDVNYQSAIGAKVTGEDGMEHTVEHPGVAAHPGDKGMEYIAQTILAKFQK